MCNPAVARYQPRVRKQGSKGLELTFFGADYSYSMAVYGSTLGQLTAGYVIFSNGSSNLRISCCTVADFECHNTQADLARHVANAILPFGRHRTSASRSTPLPLRYAFEITFAMNVNGTLPSWRSDCASSSRMHSPSTSNSCRHLLLADGGLHVFPDPIQSD